jgi:SCY1-like protein 1
MNIFGYFKMGNAQTRELPYEVKEPIASYEGKTLWKLNSASKKVRPFKKCNLMFFGSQLDKSGASILSFDLKKNVNKQATATNYYKRLRTLRHPNVLTYLDGLEIEGISINIVTEEVVPLSDTLEEAKKHPSSLVWGIYQITVGKTICSTSNKLLSRMP